MSSLRVETLRLCWLEAFIKVSDEENISGAARELGIDQSTASRYLQSLEKWLGKKLVEPGRVIDPQNARISIGITEEGRKFREIAVRVLGEINDFRTENAKRDEILEGMDEIVEKMKDDQSNHPDLPSVKFGSQSTRIFDEHISPKRDMLPLLFLAPYYQTMRSFFSEYEVKFARERRIHRKRGRGISGRDIDMSLWKPSGTED